MFSHTIALGGESAFISPSPGCFSHFSLFGTSEARPRSLYRSLSPLPASSYNRPPEIHWTSFVLSVGVLIVLRSRSVDWFETAKPIADEDTEVTTEPAAAIKEVGA